MKRSTLVICGLLTASLLCIAPFGRGAWAGDILDGLTPLSPKTLGGVTFQNNTFQTNNVNTNSPVTGNTVVASGNGHITNGAIANNVIANNTGITTVLANTGNNVSFNNTTVLNLNLH